MEFLKKHYEKLILLLLLLAFIGTMMYVLEIIRQTREVTEASLQIPTRSADHQPKKEDDPIFDVDALVASTALDWKTSEARSKGADSAFPGYYSDLVNVFAITNCPFCGKVIPRGYLEKQELCPFCKNEAGEGKGEKFKKPPVFVMPVGFPRTAEDPTGCGIPLTAKQQYGLNADDPDDARYDMDGDGFSNVYEYRIGTNMSDPNNHPPFWHRLKALRVGQKKLEAVFTGIQKLNSEDKSHWLFDIAVERGRKLNLKLGQSLIVDGIRYTLTDLEKRANGVQVLKLTSMAPARTLDLVENVAPTSPDVTADLMDVFTQKTYENVKVKSSITVDTPRRRMRMNYRVQAIDPEAGTVTLEMVSGGRKEDPTVDEVGEPMVVSTRGRVPEHMMVREPVRQMDEGPGFMPPDRPRPGNRPNRPWSERR